VIIDACYSYFLAYGRGPGGKRRHVEGFSALEQIPGDVGFLLSTSAARESHEWEAFQAGIFSHEVRSGLFGAADADHDGVVSYREIAAFVQRANAGIANERYRPQIYARPPKNSETLLDLRDALARGVEIEATHAGRYMLEDARGVRLADLHGAEAVRVVRPENTRLYLHDVERRREYEIAADRKGPLRLSALTPRPPRVSARGALHDAFDLLFCLPFDATAVAAFQYASLETKPEPTSLFTRENASYVTAGVGVVTLGVAAGLLYSAKVLRDAARTSDSQQDVWQRNQTISARNQLATGLAIGGAVALVGGAILYLWPQSD
jgi:hypothetical protein